MDEEQKRMLAWILDVKDSCDKEAECIGVPLKEKEARVPVPWTEVGMRQMTGQRTVWLATLVLPLTLPWALQPC